MTPQDEFEAAWASLSATAKSATTLKEACEIFFRKGRYAGQEAEMRDFFREPQPQGLVHFATDSEAKPAT